MKAKIAGLILLASCFGATAQQTKILTAEKTNDYGLVYTLPTTGLKITVTATAKTSLPGPYYAYAKKYLGVSDVVKEKTVEWTINDITAVPVGVNDDSEKYLMQFKPGVLTYIGVDSNGMLLSINTKPEVPESAELSRGAAKKISSTNSEPVDAYLKYVDMDFVSSQSSMKQAEMIASSLMDVRDAYLSLTRGTADNMPTDGRQLELMLASLRQQEEALMRAFTGTDYTETYTRDYLYIPDAEGEEVLFRFSDFAGFTDVDDYSGEPVYVATEILLEASLPVDANGEEKKMPKDAVAYSLPGTAKISLSMEGETLYELETEFSQFGKKFGLAPTLFSDKKAPSYAVFDPATGALKEIGKASPQ